MKLKNVVTRRVLKMFEDEMKRDASKYDKWFEFDGTKDGDSFINEPKIEE